MESNARTLVAFEVLPPRAKLLDRAQAETDIREAYAVLERRLYDLAQKYTVGGYEWGEPVIEHAGSHTLRGTLRLERPA